MKFLKSLYNGSFLLVCCYGFFVMISLLLQCFIPFLQTFGSVMRLSYMLPFLNDKFVLPMENITWFWTAIAAGYVGLDRAMFAADGLKHGMKIEAFSETKRIQLVQVIFWTAAIYILAVGLNIFFDADLALTPLATALGSTILAYVSGNKLIGGAQKLHPDEDLDQDGIRDTDQYNKTELEALREKYTKLKETAAHSQCIMHGQLNADQQTALAQMIVAMKSGKQTSSIITQDGKIIFKEYDKSTTQNRSK